MIRLELFLLGKRYLKVNTRVSIISPSKKQLLENKFSKKTESRKQLYAVIRQADGNVFKSSSYAKVVNTSILKPTDLNTIAMFGDKRVYVQNVGDKAYCEQIKKE